jgi:hypothetical protein
MSDLQDIEIEPLAAIVFESALLARTRVNYGACLRLSIKILVCET